MEKDLKSLIKDQKIQVKLGTFYCTHDNKGNVKWHIEQILIPKY